MISLKELLLSGKKLLPLIEGGKGISVTTGESAGAWAAAGGVGTFSGVNADYYDEKGKLVEIIYQGKTRVERHRELIEHAVKGAIAQAKIAFERASGKGRIHMNILWEMAGAEEILNRVLEGAKGLIHGVTSGAGMPYKMGEICSKAEVYYYPIVSSARAFRALWKRAYSKTKDFLGGVVYEDPWLAGGHNGLSNSENPLVPEAPYNRVLALRSQMREEGVENIPIIMAGGVWALNEWSDWIDNPDLGAMAFQFGTRPLLTQESTISDAWKQKLLTLEDKDVLLQTFSPTGFYSSAVKNNFLLELMSRSSRQIIYKSMPEEGFTTPLPLGPRGREVFVTDLDRQKALDWMSKGFTEALKTPDGTIIFVERENALQIRKDQVDCMGCLSACLFSNWSQHGDLTTGKKADPRSFCIQKTLYSVSHGGSIDNELMFAGHNAYRFAKDPFYANGFIPTVQQLIDRICTGA
ncbi:MAG: nitronate monooxygenase [Alphaproteobacteria bacterium]|nr:nitronate monooxygenase [Alphaproteobacteria bacterium]